MTTITATVRPGTATIDVDVTGAPAGDIIMISRSDANGYDSITYDFLGGSQTTYMVTDWAAALRGNVTYHVETSDTGDNVTSSATTTTAFPAGMSPVISNAFSHGAVTAKTVETYSLDRTTRNIVHDIYESNVPVVVFRDPGLFHGTFTLITSTLDEARSIEAFLAANNRTLMLRDQEHGLDVRFKWETSRIDAAASHGAYWRLSVQFSEYPRELNPRTGKTFQQLVDDNETFHTVALGNTFNSLANGGPTA